MRAHVSVCVRAHVSVCVLTVGEERRLPLTCSAILSLSRRPLGYICRSKHIIMEVLLMEAITAVLF